MFVKSFQKQVQKVFSQAAYKTTGIHFDCLSTPLPQSPLSFKVDIAQRIYKSYELTDFKFCQKGTTPRSIAQEIAIFTHQNPYYTFQIDSFGQITISPTFLYYKKMRESLLDRGKMHHFSIFEKANGSQLSSQNQNVFVFYKIEESSLSCLRIVKQLQINASLKTKLNEYPIEKIKKIFDFTSNSLGTQQLQDILKYKLIDVTNYNSSFVLSKSIQQKSVFALKKKGFNMIYQLKRKPNDLFLTACLRHRYIDFLAHTEGIFNQNTDQIIQVGQIFPNLKLKQTQQEQISKIISYCLKVDNLLPINLKDAYSKSYFPFAGIKQSIKGRNSSEIILLLLQNISAGKVSQSLQFLLQAKERGVNYNQMKIYDIFIRDLKELLF